MTRLSFVKKPGGVMNPRGWIGVDLDGTLAHYDGWSGPHSIGKPIKPMVDRVIKWLAAGRDVRIFTARVAVTGDVREEAERYIRAWCKEHIGYELPITCCKDLAMEEIWDDRAVGVVKNTGEPLLCKADYPSCTNDSNIEDP